MAMLFIMVEVVEVVDIMVVAGDTAPVGVVQVSYM